MPRLFAPLMILLHSLSGAQTGIYFADSTKLAVCHNRRIRRHKVFDGLAARGRTSMGWFFGLKLHFRHDHIDPTQCAFASASLHVTYRRGDYRVNVKRMMPDLPLSAISRDVVVVAARREALKDDGGREPSYPG